MNTSYISRLKITKRTVSFSAIALAALAVVATNVSLTRPASALECVRAPHTVVFDVGTANQSATPGTTLSYYMEITNNDSPGCGMSEFTFDGTNIPADWTVTPYRESLLVDAQEVANYAISYTSGVNSYNGGYAYDIEVYRAEEPTTVVMPVSYTVYGGQNVPTPDRYPGAYITSPANNSTVTTGTNVTITANATDDYGVTDVTFLVNGTVLCSGTATSCQWTVPSATGTYSIQARVTDTIGQVSTSIRTVTAVAPVDAVKPVLMITAPTANSTVKKNSTVTIRANATDNVGVTKVDFYANGTLLCTGTATSCAWTVPNARATYTIMVKAYDAAGNVTTQTLSVQSR